MNNLPILLHYSIIDIFQVYKCKGSKIRLGSYGDGGYIISDEFNNYDFLLSGGFDNNLSFEKDFIKKYNVKCDIFDKEISKIDVPDGINFINKYIDKNTLKPYFQIYDNMFLKLDIEGSEYEVFANLSRNEMKKIKQMTIEFHYILEKDKLNILNKINNTHWLIHVHPNTCSNIYNLEWIDTFDKIHNIKLPDILEMTFILRDHLELNNDELPCNLDMKNGESHRDNIDLNYYPFVTKKKIY